MRNIESERENVLEMTTYIPQFLSLLQFFESWPPFSKEQ